MLLIGGLVQPVVMVLLPPVGAIWLVLVAVSAFVSAAWIATPTASGELRSGAYAAIGSYGFMLPIVVMGSGGRIDPLQVAATSATALVVGAAVSYLRLRRSVI